MRKQRFGALSFVGLVVIGANFGESLFATTQVNEGTRVRLMDRRTSELDLEITRELTGTPPTAVRYVSREELRKLPQVDYVVSDDANFGKAVRIEGVLLEDLSKVLGVAPSRQLVIVAVCTDQYRAHYPATYIDAHHPILVLKIDGREPKDWPKNAEGLSQYRGPFLITHQRFMPSFKILAHEDEPQIPWGVARLEFRSEAEVFDSIAPRGPRAGESNVTNGFQIAQQNCFRCHNSGKEGGTKAGVPWNVLSVWASAAPDRFATYVRNPHGVNPKSQMEASPQYDDATIKALADYFQSFSNERKR